MENNNQKQLKYFQIMEDLKEQIFSGKLQPGDKIPSENQLAENYQVSRQTVRKAIEMLVNEGYVYAQHGKGTFCSERVRHTKQSKNIAVVTTYLSDYIFPRVIQGIDTVLTSDGYSIILKNTRNSRSQEARCLEELLQKDIDGMIIEPSKSQIYCKHLNLYQKMDEYEIPYVFIQGCFSQLSDKPQVLMDDLKGGYLITKYLIEQGHRKIAGVFKSDDKQGQNRHKGYVKALQEANITYDPDIVIWFYTEDRKIHPYECVKEMIESGVAMDAVVCYNDQIALHVIKAIHSLGKRVPEDISVTGYDNSNISDSINGLKLTTIAHPQEKLGQMAAELLLEMIHNPECNKEGKKILVEPELVVGNSTSTP
jgi:GntR family transcriptional regulator of arabinose operon